VLTNDSVTSQLTEKRGLDAEDMARSLTGFRGQPLSHTPNMRYVREAGDGDAAAYVFDSDSGMAYILE
jgi:hypothetical protein